MKENTSNIGNLFAFSHDPVVCVEDGRITYMNSSATSLFGRKKIGMPESALLPAHLLEIASENFVASATVNGKIVTVSRSSFMGQRLYSFILPSDSDTQIAIQSVSASMRELTNGIKTTSDLITKLSMKYEDMHLQQYSAILKHFAAKMKRLVNNYAMFAAFRQGAQPFNPIMSSVGKICQDICDEITPYTVPHDVTVTFRQTEDVFASVDAPLLSQMILNLVSNSLNHMPNGGQITLELKATRNHIMIIVEDNGTGIPTDVLINVFNGYNRNAELSEGKFTAGLGLSVADAVAKIHGGTLIIESRENVGTKVIAQIPRIIDTQLMSPKAEYKIPMHEFIMTDLSTWLSWEDYLNYEQKNQ